MAEEPIKLFSSRSERYPEPTEADAALGAGRAALAAIPFVGGSITEVLSLVLAPAVARRRDTWFKELADGLEAAERKIDGFSVENLTQNEAFVSAVIEATRFSLSTHKNETRDALRNGLLNIALHRSTDEDEQQTFLRYIDELTPSHLTVLKESRNGTQQSAEESQKKGAFYGQIMADLSARGLLSTSDGAMHAVIIGVDGKLGERATARGIAFLEFVADPLS